MSPSTAGKPPDEWVDGTYGVLHKIDGDGDWANLRSRFKVTESSQLSRVFRIAADNRCRSVVEENRYIDTDYRSEFSAYWSNKFRERSSFTKRLHFFSKRLDEDHLHRLPSEPGYLGYTVLKPLDVGITGRTMIKPPPRLNRATMVLATDHVSLFGRRLSVQASPFISQDGEFLICAHAAVWACHYHASKRGLVGRRPTSELVDLAPASVSEHRPLPSKGLALQQMQAILGATGQPALFYKLGNMPPVQGVEEPHPDPNQPPGFWDTRIYSVACRYLNSGFPVIVYNDNHAFVAFGWFRERGRIRFLVSDDNFGPYETVVSPETDRRAPWGGLMIPLPPKVHLSGEVAESTAHYLLRSYGQSAKAPAEWKSLSEALLRGELSLRTSLRSNHHYKGGLHAQGRASGAEEILRLARLSHWVWVVEVHDPKERKASRPSVKAEFVFDSTSHDLRPRWLATTLPGVTIVIDPSTGEPTDEYEGSTAWTSLREIEPSAIGTV